MTNEDLIVEFLEYYVQKDYNGLKQVVDENIVWYFLGRHKLAGVKRGMKEVIDFFDIMAGIMGSSKPEITKYIVASKDNYVIECQHIKTNREDGINIEHDVSILWTFEDGKIVSGKHFFSDPVAADEYFDAVAPN